MRINFNQQSQNNTNFKGKALIQGNPKDLEIIKEIIFLKSCTPQIIGRDIFHTGEKHFDFNYVVHEGGWSKTDQTRLYTTEKDAQDLTMYYKEKSQLMDKMNELFPESDDPAKNIASIEAIIASMEGKMPFLNLAEESTNFHKNNIERFVKLPQVVLKAGDVLKAMMEERFDYRNLKILD